MVRDRPSKDEIILEYGIKKALKLHSQRNTCTKYEGGEASRVGKRATTIVKPRKIKIQGGCMSLFLHDHSTTAVSPEHSNSLCHSKPYYRFNSLFKVIWVEKCSKKGVFGAFFCVGF